LSGELVFHVAHRNADKNPFRQFYRLLKVCFARCGQKLDLHLCGGQNSEQGKETREKKKCKSTGQTASSHLQPPSAQQIERLIRMRTL
jgi:hypothetical protein